MPEPHRPPLRIPDHELLRVVGRGAYGEVWLARNVMGTFRAVKIVRRDAFETAAPYEREFAGIRRYEPVSRSSPGLVQVLHAGRDDAAGFFFYVMELADAMDTSGPAADGDGEDYEPRTLRAELRRRGALPLADCVEIGLALTEGLARLHGTGLVHRDIKPSNIIFVRGRARLADIGLVGEARDAATMVGTAGYLAPEGPGRAAADLFAMGKVLYEAATGLEIADFPSTPPAWSAPGHEAHWELLEIVLRLCSDVPSARHPDAGTVHSELMLIRGGRSVRRLRQLERRARRARRAALVLVPLLAMSIAGWALERRRERETADNLRRSERMRFEGLLARARAERLSALPDRRAAALAVVREAAVLDPASRELRDEAMAALMLPALERAWSLKETAETDAYMGAFDEEVRRLALGRGDGTIDLIDAATGALIRKLPAPSRAVPLTYLDPFSGDDRFLFVRDVSNVAHAVHLADGRSAASRLLDPKWLARDFTRDGRWLLLGTTRHVIEMLPLLHEGPERSIPFPEVPEAFWTLYDGRRMLAHAITTNNVYMVDLEAGVVTGMLPRAPVNRIRMARPGPGDRMIVGAGEFDLYVWYMERDGEPPRTLGRHDASVRDVCFSPECRYLISTGRDRLLRLWNPVTGAQLATHGGEGQRLFWSSDYRRVCRVVADGWEVLSFTPPTGYVACFEAPPALASSQNAGPNDADFSPDGRWIATGGPDGLRIHRSTGGPDVARLACGPVPAVRFSEDGATLWYVADGGRRSLAFDTVAGVPGPSRAPAASLPHVGQIALARDGSCLLTGTNSVRWAGPDGVWHTADAGRIKGRPAVSPGGEWMAAEDADGNAVWIATTAERGLPEPAIPAGVGELGVPGNIVVARSGRGLFRAYERGMVAWDPATGLVRWENRAVPDGVIGMATASDDGLRIAATFGTKEILLLDARTGAVTSRLRPPELQHVTRLLFDRTGRRLAAACAEHVVYVWDFAGMDDGLAALGLRR